MVRETKRWRIAPPPSVLPPERSLKAETNADFSDEAVRNSNSVRSNEVSWMAERWVWPQRVLYVAIKVVAKIGSISQVKRLEDQRQRRTFLDLEVLGDPRVELKERLSPGIIKAGNRALSGAETVSVQYSTPAEGVKRRQQVVRTAIKNDRVRRSPATAHAEHIQVGVTN